MSNKIIFKPRIYNSIEEFNDATDIDEGTQSFVYTKSGIRQFLNREPVGVWTFNGFSGETSFEQTAPTWAEILSKPSVFTSNPNNFQNDALQVTGNTNVSVSSHSGKTIKFTNTQNIEFILQNTTNNTYSSVPIMMRLYSVSDFDVTLRHNHIDGTFIGDIENVYVNDNGFQCIDIKKGEFYYVFKTNTNREYLLIKHTKESIIKDLQTQVDDKQDKLFTVYTPDDGEPSLITTTETSVTSRESDSTLFCKVRVTQIGGDTKVFSFSGDDYGTHVFGSHTVRIDAIRNTGQGGNFTIKGVITEGGDPTNQIQMFVEFYYMT